MKTSKLKKKKFLKFFKKNIIKKPKLISDWLLDSDTNWHCVKHIEKMKSQWDFTFDMIV